MFNSFLIFLPAEFASGTAIKKNNILRPQADRSIDYVLERGYKNLYVAVARTCETLIQQIDRMPLSMRGFHFKTTALVIPRLFLSRIRFASSRSRMRLTLLFE